MSDQFAPRGSKKDIEESTNFTPKFDENGLIPCITTSAQSGDVLMFAFMNAEALQKTIETGEAHYWSRSRQELWHKGASSGLIQKIVEMRVDCDQDCIWISVDISGTDQTDGKEATCHVGYQSCFYRSVPTGNKADKDLNLDFNKTEKVFDPKKVYD